MISGMIFFLKKVTGAKRFVEKSTLPIELFFSVILKLIFFAFSSTSFLPFVKKRTKSQN